MDLLVKSFHRLSAIGSTMVINRLNFVLRLIAKSAQRRNKLLLLKLASSIQVANRWNNQNITIQRWNRGTEK